MAWRTYVVILLVAVVCADSQTDKLDKAEWKEVKIKQGVVRGRRDSTEDLFVFYSIPYATAPVKEHKFKAPLPPPIWQQPFDASVDKKIICPQAELRPGFYSEYLQQENCLIANVYVPDTNEKNLSVLVYVHGGAFVVGHGELIKAKNLILKDKDIILVTFNYRLSVHGFLCLGTEDIPGNAGMKDQVALLRWVQDNIGSFGGNPEDVTIAGFSAGSAAVNLLMLSKSAEGLFHRVISESGGNLAAFSIQRNPLQIAKDQAKKWNFTNVDDIYALEKFYKTAPMELFTSDPFFYRTDAIFLFSPCVERDTGDGAFLTESPLTVLRTGNYRKLPMLYGFTNMEGLLRIEVFDLWKQKMNEKFSNFLSADLKFDSEEEKEEVAAKIKKFYFGDKPVGEDNILEYVDFMSDVYFTFPMLWAVKLHAEAGNNQLYLYEYSFVDQDTPYVPHTNVRGADHCAQTWAVADGVIESIATPERKNMKKIMREIWHNFVKTGKPIPEGSSLPTWPPAGANRSPHMSLGEKVELRGPLLEERFRFWEDIYSKYYLEPVPLVAYAKEWKSVNIKQGPLRGRLEPDGGLYVFYNIPYASAPTGRDRFKAPLPPPVWMSTFDAVDRGIVCPQSFSSLKRQEDCLVANVFVPDVDDINVPVLVYIHGGAYQSGYGNSGTLKEFVRTKKVIVVSFNYRLGVHGFLCLGTETAPGNAGLKDQVALLRWVNANIASFGGNPEDVTLAACSAGSGSADALTLSSITTGLFKKAILESGISIGATGVQINPIENAKSYARILNFTDVDNLEKLEEFYQTATFEQLTSHGSAIADNQDLGIRFGPCVEKDIGQERVIADAPMNVITRGNYTKIPLMYGFANMDGSMRLPLFNTWKDEMNENFSNFLPGELYFKSEDVKQEVAKKVKEFYFGTEPINEQSIVSFIFYITDAFFGYPMLRALSARVDSLGEDIYLFEHSFADENSQTFPHTEVRGAGHCDHMSAVRDQNGRNKTEEYKIMQNTVRNHWHNFILHATPTTNGSWPPASAQRTPYLSIGQTIELRNNILEDRAAFWDEIYDKYYRGPVLPDSTDASVSLLISNSLLVFALITVYFGL